MEQAREDRSLTRVLVTGGSGFIGTNLIAHLVDHDYEVANLSRSAPKQRDNGIRFYPVDILSQSRVHDAVMEFEPSAVIHLASETRYLPGSDEQAYIANTAGTRNVIAALNACPSVARCVLASSHVVDEVRFKKAAGTRQSGQAGYRSSKIEMENIVRGSVTEHVSWCLIRPCSVWGPGFGEPFRNFFIRVANGRYVHLGSLGAKKTLSYVGNAVHQIRALLECDLGDMERGLFYLADYSYTSIRDWADLIAQEAGTPPPFSLPDSVAKILAAAGDLVERRGLGHPPLTSRRLENMRRDQGYRSLEAVQRIAPELPFDLKTGIRRTLAWLHTQGFIETRNRKTSEIGRLRRKWPRG